VPAVEVERLLSLAVSRRTNLPSALAAERPELLELLERELGRAEMPSLEMVRPQADLVAALPDGLCERLGALPVRQDPRSGRIDVAVLDPVDPHVARELEFHLDAPVRLLRARFDAFDAALRQSHAGAPRAPSGPPLPLVRRAARSGANASLEAEDERDDAPPPSAREDDEPVLSLTRSKPRHTAPLPPPPMPPEPPSLEASLGELAKAQNPDEVVTALVAGLRPAPAIVLAVRGQAYEGRAGAALLDAQGVRRIRLPAGVPSVAETAVRQGFYLGTLPLTATHGGIRDVLKRDADGEVYVTQVSVSSRPSLVVVIALVKALGPSMQATRRVDELCRAAGHALESIVVTKKRGGVA
jgi:uncharacterized protein (UPF0548 family)